MALKRPPRTRMIRAAVTKIDDGETPLGAPPQSEEDEPILGPDGKPAPARLRAIWAERYGRPKPISRAGGREATQEELLGREEIWT